MNYLQFNDRGKFEPEEQALANYFGEGNYTGFYKKHFLRDKFQITKNDFISGEIDVIFHAMKKLGIEYSYTDYPECLKPYLYRKVWEDELGNVKRELFEEGYLKNPIFIKPKDKLKRFTGFVLETIDDLSNCKNAGNQTKIWCSEPVTFVDEYRCYFLWDTSEVGIIDDFRGEYKVKIGNHKGLVPTHTILETVRKVGYYLTNPTNSFLGEKADFPNAFALDFGTLPNGHVALIEMNDAFSLGLYKGCSDNFYAECLIARWKELKGDLK